MFKKLLSVPYAVFMLLFVLLPLALILVFAFIDAGDGSFDMLANFKELAKEDALGKIAKNSFIAGFSTSAICLLIGYLSPIFLPKKNSIKRAL